MTLSNSPAAVAQQLVDEIGKLMPKYLEDPIDRDMSRGNAAVCVIDPTGRVHGQIFGTDKAKARWCLGIATRKVLQVYSTGYPTGRFEELVYAGKLDDKPFGINRPDFIGWLGGVPLQLADGSKFAAAFSAFRGENDVKIIHEATTKIPGLKPVEQFS